MIKSPDWLEAAVKKLKFVLKGLIKIVGNKSELVRLELAILSCSILEKTSRYFENKSFKEHFNRNIFFQEFNASLFGFTTMRYSIITR